MAPRSVCFGVRSRKLSIVGQSLDGWPKINYLELLRASEGTLSRWSRLHLQSLSPTNSHWARVVSYGPFNLCVIHKEGLCPSSGDIIMLMMMITNHSKLWSNYTGVVQAYNYARTVSQKTKQVKHHNLEYRRWQIKIVYVLKITF
jgi:hypothetical protein